MSIALAEASVLPHLIRSGAAALLTALQIEWHDNVPPEERADAVRALQRLNVTLLPGGHWAGRPPQVHQCNYMPV